MIRTSLFLCAMCMLLVTSAFAQEPADAASESKFPYGKMLKMTHDELLDAKFKFDDHRNQYVLRKTNGLNTAVSIMGALNGTPANYVPHVDDYQVIIQKSASNVAFIEVTFYNTNLYHEILTFASDQGNNLLETNSGSVNKTQFNYDNYSFVITYRQVGQSSTTASGTRAVKTQDQSYNVYSFTIFTGEDPFSDFLLKEAMKEQKRDDKGKKKRSAADLM